MALGDFQINPDLLDTDNDVDMGQPDFLTNFNKRLVRDRQKLGSTTPLLKQKEPDNVAEFAVDQLQKLGYEGLETIGGTTPGRAIGLGGLQEFGREGALEQERQIEEGGYQSTYQGSFLEQEGFGKKLGWAAEKMLENSGPTVAGLAGLTAAALTAPVSLPAAAVITATTAGGIGLLGMGEVTSEQREKGLDPNYDVSAGVGALIGALDVFGLGKILPRNVLSKITTGELIDVLVEKGEKEAAKGIARQIFEKAGTEALTEGMQEGLAIGATNTLGGQYNTNEVVNRLVDAAVVGGTMGGTIGGADVAYGKFSEASKNVPPAPKQEERKGGVEVDEHGQLRLFRGDDLPTHAELDKKGKTVVVNPINGTPIKNKKIEQLVKFLADLEAAKMANPAKAAGINRNIRKAIGGLKKQADIKGGKADIVELQETDDIIEYYQNKLKAETQAKKQPKSKQQIFDFSKPAAEKKTDYSVDFTTTQAPSIPTPVSPVIEPPRAATETNKVPDQDIPANVDIMFETINASKQDNGKFELLTEDGRDVYLGRSGFGLQFDNKSQALNYLEEHRNRIRSRNVTIDQEQASVEDIAAKITAMRRGAIEGSGVAQNIQPTVTPAPLDEMGDFLNQAGDPDSPSAVPQKQLNFTEWYNGQSATPFTKLSKTEQSEYIGEYQEYKKQFEPQTPTDSGLRDIEAVTNIPAPKRSAAPKKEKIYEKVEEAPDNAITTAKGTPFKSSKGANVVLSKKGLKDTHQVVELDGGGFVIAPYSEQEIRNKIYDLRKQEAPQQDLEIKGEITTEDVAKLSQRWGSLLEIKGTAEYVQNVNKEIEDFVAGGKEWNSDEGKALYRKVKDTIEGKPSKKSPEAERQDQEEDILAPEEIPVEATEGFTGLGAALQKAQARQTKAPVVEETSPELASTQKQEVKAEIKAEDTAGEQIAFEEDEDVARFEKEAERLSKEDKEVRDEIIDTEAIDLKKENVWIDGQISDLKEEGYVEADDEIKDLRSQRRRNVERLKELGAIKPVVGRKSKGADITEETGEEEVNLIKIDHSDKVRVNQYPASTREQKKRTFDFIKENINPDLNVSLIYLNDPSEMKNKSRYKYLKDNNMLDAGGVHFRGNIFNGPAIYIFGDNRKNVHSIHTAVLHELVGHYGLRNLFGDAPYDDFIFEAIRKTPKLFQRAWDRIGGAGNPWGYTLGEENVPGLDVDVDGRKRRVGWDTILAIFDEYIARSAEDLRRIDVRKTLIPEEVGLLQRVKDWWQAKIRELGWKDVANLEENDIHKLVAKFHSEAFKDSPFVSGAVDRRFDQIQNRFSRNARTNADEVSFSMASTRYNYPTWLTDEQYKKNKAFFDRFVKRINIPIPKLEIKWVERLEDLPRRHRKFVYEKYDKNSANLPRGLHYREWNGEKSYIYIIGRAQSDPAQITKTLLHEVVGHYGIRTLFPGEQWDSFMSKSLLNTPELFQKAVDRIVGQDNFWGIDLRVKDGEDSISVNWNGQKQQVSKEQAIRVLDEYIAKMAEDLSNPELLKTYSNKELGWARRLIAWVRHKLRSFGIGTEKGEYKLTDDDIYGLLTEIHSKSFKDSPYKSVRDFQQEVANRTDAPDALQRMTDTFRNPYYINRDGELVFTESMSESIKRTTRIGKQLMRMKKNIISVDTINQIKKQKGIRKQDRDLVNDVLESMGSPSKVDKNEFLIRLSQTLFPLNSKETDTYADWGVEILGFEFFDDLTFNQIRTYYNDEELWNEIKSYAQNPNTPPMDLLNKSVPPGIWREGDEIIEEIDNLINKLLPEIPGDVDNYISKLREIWKRYFDDYNKLANNPNTVYNNKTQLYSTPFDMPESGHFLGESENYAGHTRTLDRGAGRYLLEVQSDTAQSLNKDQKPLTPEEHNKLQEEVNSLGEFIDDLNAFEKEMYGRQRDNVLQDIATNMNGYHLGYYSPSNASFEIEEDIYKVVRGSISHIKEKAHDDLSKKITRLKADAIGAMWGDQFQPYIYERLINENINQALQDGKSSYYVPTHHTAQNIEGWNNVVTPEASVRFKLTPEEKEILNSISGLTIKDLTGDIYISGFGTADPRVGTIESTTFSNEEIEDVFSHTRIRGRRNPAVEAIIKKYKEKEKKLTESEHLLNRKEAQGLLSIINESHYRDITKPEHKKLEDWYKKKKPSLDKFNNYVRKNFHEDMPLSPQNFGIWNRYRTDIANFVKEQYNAELTRDEKGNDWYKIDLTKLENRDPIVAFQVATPINSTEASVNALRQGTNIQDLNAMVDLMGSNFGRSNRQWFGRRYGELLQAFRKKFPQISALLDPSGSLPFAGPKRALHNYSLGEKDLVDTLARNSHKILKQYKDANVNQGIVDYFSTPDAPEQMMTGVSEEHQAELKTFKDAIVALGERLVNLGALSEETFEANKGAYLPGRYMKYLTQYKGSGTKISPMFYLRQTKDLTETEKIELGRIVDADFLIPELIATIGRDVSLMQYFRNLNDLSNNQSLGWVLGGERIEINNREYTLFELEQQINLWDDQINTDASTLPFNMSQGQLEELIATRDEAKEMVAERQREIQESVRQIIVDRDGDFNTIEEVPDSFVQNFLTSKYKQVPKNRSYGELAGQYVRTELYDEIVDSAAVAYNINDMDGLSRFLAPHSGLDTSHQIWKAGKVLWNPPSWFRNFFGNTVLLDISTPTNFIKLGHMVADEAQKAAKGNPSKYWMMAQKMGLFGTTFSANELYLLNKKWEKDIQRQLEQSTSAVSRVKKGYWAMQEALYQMSELLSRGYGGMEGMFKTVALRDFIQRWEKENGRAFESLGRLEKETLMVRAADSANSAIFDYSDIPAWLRTLRRAPLGAPFLTFTYKSFPAIMRGMANQPQKFAKYLALPYALMYMATSFGDLDEDDLVEFQKKAPKWMQEKSGVYVIPVKDEHGRMQAMDFGYMFPWTPFVDIWNSSNVNWKADEPLISTVGAAGETVKSLGLLGGPLPSMITGLTANQENFFGNQIVPDGATSEEKMWKSSAWLYDLWMPSFFGSKGVTGKLMDRMGLMPDSLSRQKDVWGNPRSTLGQDTLRTVGMNVYSVDPNLSNIQNIRGFEYEAGEIKKQRSKTMRNHNLDTQTKIKRLKEFNSKLIKLNERRQKYFQGGF